MIELEAKLPDLPGTLLKFLKPISENNGNIYGIIHSHSEKIGEYVPVLVRFDIISEDKQKCLENIKKSLLDLNIQILKITDIPAVYQIVVIISGHVFRNNVEDIIVRINKVGGKVFDLDAKFDNPEDISNVKFLIEIPDEIDDKAIIKELQNICKEKGLFLLTEEDLE
jgi:ACT domain-containing protein